MVPGGVATQTTRKSQWDASESLVYTFLEYSHKPTHLPNRKWKCFDFGKPLCWMYGDTWGGTSHFLANSLDSQSRPSYSPWPWVAQVDWMYHWKQETIVMFLTNKLEPSWSITSWNNISAIVSKNTVSQGQLPRLKIGLP